MRRMSILYCMSLAGPLDVDPHVPRTVRRWKDVRQGSASPGVYCYRIRMSPLLPEAFVLVLADRPTDQPSNCPTAQQTANC